MQYTGGNHEYSRGYLEYTGGVQYTGGYHDKCGGSSLGKQVNLYGNPSVLNISWCTHDISPHSSWYPPVYSWYLPSVLETPAVLMISLHTHHRIPRCTHVIPQCTEHPGVLNDTSQCIEHSRCTAQTLCRVITGVCIAKWLIDVTSSIEPAEEAVNPVRSRGSLGTQFFRHNTQSF